MSHDIWADRAVFTGEQNAVWHHIGKYLGDQKITDSSEWLRLAGLDYDVYQTPVFFSDGTEIPNTFAIARDRVAGEEGTGPFKLGITTEQYKILSNTDAFKFFDPLVQEGLAEYTAAGALREGARIWIAAKLTSGTVRTNPDGTPDTVNNYVMLFNGHDGKISAQVNVSNVRSVCANTISMALKSGTTYKARHKGNIGMNMDQMRNKLAEISKEFGNTLESYKTLAAKRVNSAEVKLYFETLFPLPEAINAKDGQTVEVEHSSRRKNQITKMEELFLTGKGNGGGTVWDLFNGVTEYIDHFSTKNTDTTKHLDSIWFGQKASNRERALEAALLLAQGKLIPDMMTTLVTV